MIEVCRFVRPVALTNAFAGALLLLLAKSAVAQIAAGPDVNPRAVWSRQQESFEMRVVADGFEDPWEVTWGPDDYLWITERTGKRVVRVNPEDGSRSVAASGG